MSIPFVVAGFPGVGKSTAYRKIAEDADGTYADMPSVIDLDPSDFSEDGWPQNYIEHVKWSIEDVKKSDGLGAKAVTVICVSTHKEVRNALREAGIPFILVFPSPDRKEEFIQRYKDRGSPQALIETISNSWDEWLADLQGETVEQGTASIPSWIKPEATWVRAMCLDTPNTFLLNSLTRITELFFHMKAG